MPAAHKAKLPGYGRFFDAPNRMIQMIFDGVFDRFPELDVVFAETDLGWVPYVKEQIDNNFQRLRHANGEFSTAGLRLEMQRTMTAHAAVFRTDELMVEGKAKLAETYKRMEDLHVSDRGLIWNSDLIETMELDNLISQAVVTMKSADNRKESRGAHMHEDFPDRDDANWMKHTVTTFDGWGGKGGATAIDYRPVHDYTLTDDVEYIKPKKRVY